MSAARRRLDAELVRRQLAETRTQAHETIRAGRVTVNGAPAAKPATMVLPSDAITVERPAHPYVSRGGVKLARALDHFEVDVAGRRCLDAGVSTGGFTDCLLQRGARHVQAFDVGYGQVHERIRTDARVTIRERTNVRHLTADDVAPPGPDLIVADLSFISLRLVLGVLFSVARPDAEAVVLVKPQFEARREDVGRGGVVRDPGVWRRALQGVADAARTSGRDGFDAVSSPITGAAGNVEFLAHLFVVASGSPGYRDGGSQDVDACIAAAIEEVDR
ncbi:MAG: TlyA family RNA methyltransferase [Nitriliruptoraceae bacterium]